MNEELTTIWFVHKSMIIYKKGITAKIKREREIEKPWSVAYAALLINHNAHYHFVPVVNSWK